MVTNNKPQIRFKGFSDEWEQRKLGEMVDYVKGYAFKSNTYVDGGVRIVRVSDLSKTEIKKSGDMIYISKKDSELFDKYIINKSDIIVTTVGSKSEMKDSAVGRPIMVRSADEGLLNQNLVKLETKNKYNCYFIFNNLLMDRYSYYISLIERGNANQANITINDLWEYSLYTPNISEQTKIGSFFKTLDETIALRQQKLDCTKKLKKAMLQKMFPKKGSNIPEIRFKGFNEAWEEAKLGDLSEITSGEFLIKSKQDSKGKYPVFNGGTTNTGYSVLKNKSSKGDGDIVISSRGSAGSINIVTGGYWLGNSCFSLKENKVPIKTYFLFMALNHNNFSKYIHIGTIPSISKKNIEEHKIKLPKSKKEQELIGKYFKDLDTQISLQENKLDIYKQFKKAMLQKMFI